MTAPAIPVVAGLIAKDGRLLICQRRAGDILALKWEFPGGKVKPGESLEHALVRELREELDVQVTVGDELYRTAFTYSEPPRSVEIHFFPARICSGELRNLAFEQLVWAAPAQLAEFDFLPADRELVDMLASGQLIVGDERFR